MPSPLTDRISVREALECQVPDDASLARVLAETESLTRGAEDGQLRHHLQRAVDGLIAARHRLRRLVTGALPEIQTAAVPDSHESGELGVGSMPHPAAGLSAPLVSLGQGVYRTDIGGDPRTGRLDVRA